MIEDRRSIREGDIATREIEPRGPGGFIARGTRERRQDACGPSDGRRWVGQDQNDDSILSEAPADRSINGEIDASFGRPTDRSIAACLAAQVFFTPQAVAAAATGRPDPTDRFDLLNYRRSCDKDRELSFLEPPCVWLLYPMEGTFGDWIMTSFMCN